MANKGVMIAREATADARRRPVKFYVIVKRAEICATPHPDHLSDIIHIPGAPLASYSDT